MITEINISGGGFGHGVGMSQYGAYGLSLQGYSYEQIIRHYYPDTELLEHIYRQLGGRYEQKDNHLPTT